MSDQPTVMMSTYLPISPILAYGPLQFKSALKHPVTPGTRFAYACKLSMCRALC